MSTATPAEGRSARTCRRTGLRLVPADGQLTWRVAQSSYGAMAPQPREGDYTGVLSWARWDTAGGRTIYTAESELFAYLEVLAYLTPSDGLDQLPLTAAFPQSEDPEDHDTESVLDRIRTEWEHKFGNFGPGKNPQRWREARGIYTVELPTDGWFIDIAHNDTIAALNRSGGPLGGPLCLPRQLDAVRHQPRARCPLH